MSNQKLERAAKSGVVFFGSRCEFSRRAIAALRSEGVRVLAVVLPGPPGQREPIRQSRWPAINRLQPPSGSRPINLTTSAASGEVPVYDVARLRDGETTELLRGLSPAIFTMACHPRRIPAELLAVPPFGTLNVHPSLLPDNRGPDPLFWTYRRADSETGVTVHVVDRTLDTGPIVAQRSLPVPLGIPGAFLWDRLATIGSEMLASATGDALAGRLVAVDQDEARATYYSWPGPEDLLIPLDEWGASRVYHFWAGVTPFGYGPRVRQQGRLYEIERVSIVDQSTPPVAGSGQILLRCREGRVLATAKLIG